MKRLIALILMLVIAFSCVACGPKKADEPKKDTGTSATDQTQKDVEEATTE
jgi:hypothetical protein